jgi:hypothetical protein
MASGYAQWYDSVSSEVWIKGKIIWGFILEGLTEITKNP